jgi:hypothetical protein
VLTPVELDCAGASLAVDVVTCTDAMGVANEYTTDEVVDGRAQFD